MKIQHPENNSIISGKELGPGTTLKAGDLYASSDGTWKKCPSPGSVIEEDCEAVWVRPD